MNKHLIALAGLALLLGGCASHHHGPMRGAERPVVEVAADGVKAVRPDPLRFRQGQGAAVIIWRLGADGYSFPANGIVIDGVTGLTYLAYTTSQRTNGHIARLGVNYHFNWGGSAPVVARY